MSVSENNKTYLIDLNLLKFLMQADNREKNNALYQKEKKKLKLKKSIRKIYKKIIEPFFFPDKYILASKAVKNTLNTCNLSNFDTVIIGVTPFSLVKISKYIKEQNSNIKIIIDYSDPFFKNATHSWFKNLFAYSFERKYLKYANHIVFLYSNLQSIYSKTYGKDIEDKILIIEQGISEDIKEFAIVKQKAEKQLKIIYAGGFYKKIREPFELYKAISNLGDNVSLNIYGKIPEEFLPACLPTNIHFHCYIKNNLIWTKFAASNVLVLIDNAIGYQVPGKTIEYLAMNKPILYISDNFNSPTSVFIKEFEGVYFCSNLASEIKKVIEKIISEIFTLKISRNIEKFYWHNLTKIYVKAINS